MDPWEGRYLSVLLAAILTGDARFMCTHPAVIGQILVTPKSANRHVIILGRPGGRRTRARL